MAFPASVQDLLLSIAHVGGQPDNIQELIILLQIINEVLQNFMNEMN